MKTSAIFRDMNIANKTKWAAKWLAAITVAVLPGLCWAQTTLLHCGRMIDGKGMERKEVTIAIDGKKIVKIDAGYSAGAAGQQVIDLKNQTVMPGWIDCHVHVETQYSSKSYEERYQLNPADVAYRAEKYAQTLLKSGFTTVRDLGGSGVNVALRNAINQGRVVGPTIITAGKAIATTGGHGDPSNGLRKDLAGHPGPEAGVANGPDECRKAVRTCIQNGSDVIKITATGGVLSVARDGSSAQFQDDELAAVVATARDYGLRVAAHAHGAEGIKRALRAGVNSIEHGSYIDEECIALFKKMGAYYVPTLTAGNAVTDSAKIPGFYPDVVQVKASTIGPRIAGAFRMAHKGGVKIAFGTDAGVFEHGKNYLEFIYMTQGGMTPMEAIISATRSAADLLGLPDKGTIEPGKDADIIAVTGNPLQDITSTKNVSFVMKGGKVIAL